MYRFCIASVSLLYRFFYAIVLYCFAIQHDGSKSRYTERYTAIHGNTQTCVTLCIAFLYRPVVSLFVSLVSCCIAVVSLQRDNMRYNSDTRAIQTAIQKAVQKAIQSAIQGRYSIDTTAIQEAIQQAIQERYRSDTYFLFCAYCACIAHVSHVSQIWTKYPYESVEYTPYMEC